MVQREYILCVKDLVFCIQHVLCTVKYDVYYIVSVSCYAPPEHCNDSVGCKMVFNKRCVEI